VLVSPEAARMGVVSRMRTSCIVAGPERRSETGSHGDKGVYADVSAVGGRSGGCGRFRSVGSRVTGVASVEKGIWGTRKRSGRGCRSSVASCRVPRSTCGLIGAEGRWYKGNSGAAGGRRRFY
jgi:hypothetical protein